MKSCKHGRVETCCPDCAGERLGLSKKTLSKKPTAFCVLVDEEEIYLSNEALAYGFGPKAEVTPLVPMAEIEVLQNHRDKLLSALNGLKPFLTTHKEMLDAASLNEGRSSDFDIASINAITAISEVESLIFVSPPCKGFSTKFDGEKK